MQIAGALLTVGTYRRIAIVSVDLASRGLDWDEPEASLIFGDGAAAAIVTQGTSHQGIAAFKLATYPEGRDVCAVRAGGTARNLNQGIADKDYLFRMDGKAVFKLAVQIIPDFLDEVLTQANCCKADIDWVVPHQASHLGMAHAAKKLGLPAEKIINIYSTHGNQVAASVPTALHELFVKGQAQAGKKILLMGTGAGLTVGAMVIDL
jgi:3-oxoacyl-[acyl-carrier-protein] synthase-3